MSLSQPHVTAAMIYAVIFMLLLSRCHGIEPEVIVVYALSAAANRTIPTDLVSSVTEWISLPSGMNMNELILCKTSTATSELWGKKCDRLIQQQISRCNANHTSCITLTLSEHVVVLEFLEDSMYFGDIHQAPPFGRFLDIMFDIYGNNSSGDEIVIKKVVNVTLGANLPRYRIPIVVTPSLVTLYKGFYVVSRSDFIVNKMTMRWRRHGCFVKNLMHLPTIN